MVKRGGPGRRRSSSSSTKAFGVGVKIRAPCRTLEFVHFELDRPIKGVVAVELVRSGRLGAEAQV